MATKKRKKLNSNRNRTNGRNGRNGRNDRKKNVAPVLAPAAAPVAPVEPVVDGDDTFTFASFAELAARGIVDGGAGNNTVVIDSTARLSTVSINPFASLRNIQNVELKTTFPGGLGSGNAAFFGSIDKTAQDAGVENIRIDTNTGLYSLVGDFTNAVHFTIAQGTHTLYLGTAAINNTNQLSSVSVHVEEGDFNLNLSRMTGAVTIADSNFAAYTNVATITGLNNAAQTVTFGTYAQEAGLARYNASAAGTSVATFTVEAGFTNGLLLQSGNGTDVYNLASTDLLSNVTIQGGNGVDSVSFSSVTAPVTLNDSDFANITGVERLLLGGTSAQTITLGTTADRAGINVLAGAGGVNTFDTTEATNSITFSMSSVNITSASILAAEASTNTLRMNVVGTGLTEAYTISVSNMTNVDNLIVVGFSSSVTLTDTVGLTNVTGSTFADTFDASGVAESVTLKGGGGADVLTAGADRTLFVFDSIEHYTEATISATEGYNIISLASSTAGITLQDSDFENLAYIRTFQGTSLQSNAVTFGSNAQAAGLYSFTANSGTFANTFTIEDGFTSALDITSANGADTYTINSTEFHNLVSGGGNDTFTLNVVPPNIMINGGTGTDTVSFAGVTDGVTLGDLAFRNFAGVENLVGSASTTNAFTFGTYASAAGLRTVTGGTDADSFTFDGFTTTLVMNGGDGDDTYHFTSQANFTTAIGGTATVELVGGDGVNTVSFAGSTSAITITDTHFMSMRNIDSLVLGNGTNVVTLGANATSAGIDSVIGGTSADTINASSFAGSSLTLQGWAGLSTDNTSDDTLTGGSARDLFVLGDANGNAYGSVGTNAATITGFNIQFDKIQLAEGGIGDVTFTNNNNGEIRVEWGGAAGYTINFNLDRSIGGGSIVDDNTGNTVATFTDGFLGRVEARNFTFL